MTKFVSDIRDILIETSGRQDVPENDDLLSKNLTTDLGLDSLDVINMLFQVEEKYDLKIPEDDIDKFDLLLVENLVKYLSERV